MNVKSDITVVTERGQTSIPAHLRKAMGLGKGCRFAWERVGEDEIRVRVLRSDKADPRAMLGFAKRFRATRRTSEWMKILREGED